MIKVSVGIRQLNSGTWQIRFRSKGRKEANINLSPELSKREVQREKAHYEREISLGRFNPWEQEEEVPRLAVALSMYITESAKYRWNKKTHDSKIWVLNRMKSRFQNNRLNEIKEWNWFNSEDVSPTSKKNYLRDTKAFLNWCVKQGFITSFTLQLTQSTKDQLKRKTIKYITWQQVKSLEEWYLSEREKTSKFTPHALEPERHTNTWWLMFWLCLRREELIALTPSDIKGNYIGVRGKGGGYDVIPIPSPAKKYVEWFIANPKCENLIGFASTNSLKDQLSRAIKNVLPKHHSKGFHQFRHGGAVHYLSLGKPLIFVSKLLRHKSTTITAEVYADIIEGLEYTVFEDVEDAPVSQKMRENG